MRHTVTVLAALTAALFVHAPSWAQESDPFHGKDISLIVGNGPAGGFDQSARLFVRHYGRFLPGNPLVVVKNVPGAGGLIAANHIFNVAPKDGTELGLFPTSVALEPLFHNQQAKYETNKFTWIGNMNSDASNSCGAWKQSGIKTWQDVKNRVTTIGAAGPSGESAIYSKVIADLLGLKTKVILGYTSSQTVLVAMQRGEIDGSCGLNVVATYAQFKEQARTGDLVIWMTFGRQRVSEFPDAPTVYELIKNDNDMKVAELVFGQNRINRGLSAPPGLSPQLTKRLRTAFMATMTDKTFLADAEKSGVLIHPMTGEETATIYQSFYDEPKEVVERTIKIMGRME